MTGVTPLEINCVVPGLQRARGTAGSGMQEKRKEERKKEKKRKRREGVI